MKQSVLLNGDGSLVVRYHYSIAEGSADIVAGGNQIIQEWQDKPRSTPPHWLADRKAMQRHFSGSGVRLQAFDEQRKDGRRHIYITVFAEDGPAAINQGLFGALRCERTADGHVRLSAHMPAIPAMDDLEKREAIAALCDDLYLELEFSVPGDIVSTTAHRKKRKTAAWIFDPSGSGDFLTHIPTLECRFEGSRFSWAETLPEAAVPDLRQQ